MQITSTSLIQVAALVAAVGSVSAAPVPSAGQLLAASHSQDLARRDMGQDVQNFFSNLFHPEKAKAEREKKAKEEADKKKADEDKKKAAAAPAQDADALDRRDIGEFFRNIFHPDPARVEKEKKEKEENDRKIKELKEKMEKEDREKKAKAAGTAPPTAAAPAVNNTSNPPTTLPPILLKTSSANKSASDKSIPAQYHDAIIPYMQGGKHATGHRRVVCFAGMQAHTWTFKDGMVIDGHAKGAAHLTHGKDKASKASKITKHAAAAEPTTSSSPLSFLFGGHPASSKAAKNPHDEMDHPAVCISYDANPSKNGTVAASGNKSSTKASMGAPKQAQTPLLTKVQQAQVEQHSEDTGRGKQAAEQKAAGSAPKMEKPLSQMNQDELREKLQQLLLASGSGAGNSKKQTLTNRAVASDGLAAGKANAEFWDQYNAQMSGEPTALEESYELADEAARQHPPIQSPEVSDSAPSSLDAALRKAGAIKRFEARSLLDAPSFDFAPRSVSVSRER